MYELAEKVIELRLATRRACMCENRNGVKKNTLSLKTKVLFLISKNYSPKEIINSAGIVKTNLALLTRDMADEGLIDKIKGSLDRREVVYSITEAGKRYLSSRLSEIESCITEKFVSDEQYGEAMELIDNAISLLGE